MSVEPWWEEFFGEPWSRIQAGGYPRERTAAQCDLIERALDPKPGSRILDIPCGIGRHSVELARRGYELTGVDFKAEYVAQAQASAEAGGVPAQFVVGDMREFATDRPFDAGFCYFGSFGYFSEEDDLRFMRAVSRALLRGARFLLEGHILETLLPIFREREWYWGGSPENRVRVVEERTWNMGQGRVESVWTIVGEGALVSSRLSIRIYSFRELRALLEAAGFVSVRALDGKTGEPLQLGASRALIVAENS